MSGSEIFRRVRKYLRVALHCERTGQPSKEALEELDYRQNKARARRRFLTAIGAGAAVSAIPAGMRPAFAAPSVSGGIAIVGAGLAGLSAAYTLAGKGVRAHVFEASERAGGRCFSLYDFFPGQVAERGGEFIDTGHVTMRGFANTFGLSLEAVSKLPGEAFYFIDGQHYDEAQVVEEFRAFVPRMREDLQKLTPPTADDFTEDDRILDLTNMQDYLRTRGAGPLIGKVLDVAYTIEYGREIEEQSCLNLLLFIHADRRSKFRPFGVFSDERFHVVEGNDGITTGLANSLPQGVSLGHRLLRARRLSDGRVQLAFNVGRQTMETEHDAVVFAVPFSILREVELDASLGLPDWKRFAIDNFQYGTNSKMMIGFNGRPWYDLHGSNGSSYSSGLRNHQNTWETNPIRASASNAILTDYSGGRRGERLDPRRVQTEASTFLGDLEKVYPGAGSFVTRDARGRILVHLENWSKNPLYKGSYTCNAPGYFTTIAGNEAKPVDNLFFAGEHTDSFYSYQGFMEGACLSGLRAATESFNFLRGK